MVSVGVVGAGIYGRVHLETFKQREREVGDVRLAAFAEINDELRYKMEREFAVKGYARVRTCWPPRRWTA